MCALTELQAESMSAVEIANAVLPPRQREGTGTHRGARQVRNSNAEGQPEWMKLLSESERLSDEVKRGRQCLKEFKRYAAELRTNLEDWAEYQKVCGRNPLLEYAQALVATERLIDFLPGWIKERSERLALVNSRLDEYGPHSVGGNHR